MNAVKVGNRVTVTYLDETGAVRVDGLLRDSYVSHVNVQVGPGDIRQIPRKSLGFCITNQTGA